MSASLRPIEGGLAAAQKGIDAAGMLKDTERAKLAAQYQTRAGHRRHHTGMQYPSGVSMDSQIAGLRRGYRLISIIRENPFDIGIFDAAPTVCENPTMTIAA